MLPRGIIAAARQSASITAESVAFALSRSLGLPLMLLPIAASLMLPASVLRTDYVANLYVAGRLVVEGRAAELYPDSSTTSFRGAPLNSFAHRLLADLPDTDVAVFMYGPLVAGMLAPFSLLSPTASLIAWQVTSLFALAMCAWILAPATGRTATDLLWVSLLYLPILQTLLIGHLAIALGVLPLGAGYACILSGRPFWAGVVWSLLFLKPQYLPAILLVAAAMALRGRVRCFLGLVAGATVLVALSGLCFSVEVSLRWLNALRLADTIFSDPQYRYPAYLVTSLPAIVLHWAPYALRDPAKVPSYALAALIGLHALWRSWKLMAASPRTEPSSIARVLLLGICALPLVVPHLLSYDLAIFVVAGMIMRDPRWPAREEVGLKRINWMLLAIVDVYLVLVMFVNPEWARPTLLIGGLGLLYAGLLATLRARPSPRGEAAA